MLTTVPWEIDLSQIRDDLLGVIETNEAVEREVGAPDKTLWMRVRPYVSAGSAVTGAALTFFPSSDVRSLSDGLGERRPKKRPKAQ